MRKFQGGGVDEPQASEPQVSESQMSEQYTPYTAEEGDSILRIARKNNPGATE